MLCQFYIYRTHADLSQGMKVFCNSTESALNILPITSAAEYLPLELLTSVDTSHLHPRLVTYSDQEIRDCVRSYTLYSVLKCSKERSWKIRIQDRFEDKEKTVHQLTSEQIDFLHNCISKIFINLKFQISNIASNIDAKAFITAQFDATTFTSKDSFQKQIVACLQQQDITKLSFSSKKNKSLLEICAKNLIYKSSIDPTSKSVILNIF